MDKFSCTLSNDQVDSNGESCVDLTQDVNEGILLKRPNTEVGPSTIKCPPPKIPRVVVKIEKP